MLIAPPAVKDDQAAELQALLVAGGPRVVLTGEWILDTAVVLPAGLRSLELAESCRLIVRGDHSALSRRGRIRPKQKAVEAFNPTSSSIPVRDAGPYRTGEVVLLSSTTRLSGSTVRPGYLRTVTRVSDRSVDVDKAVPRELVDSPLIASVALAPRVSITGGGEIFAAEPTMTKATLIDFYAVRDPSVSDIVVHENGGPGITVQHCWGGHFDCTISDLLDQNVGDFYGYGVNVAGSTRGADVRGTISRTRHAVTTNSASFITAVGSVGEPEDCVFAPVAKDCTNKALDTHRAGWNTLMIPNITGGVGGVQVRADNTRIEGGTIRDVWGPGISIWEVVGVATQISDVTIEDVRAPGNSLRSAGPSNSVNLTIRHSTGGPAIVLSDDCTVTGGSISESPVGVRFMGSGNSVSGLTLDGSVSTPYATDPGADQNGFAARGTDGSAVQ